MRAGNPGTRRFGYAVNADDRIESVTPAWLSFARENQAFDLTAEAIVGQPLFGFLTGKETKHLYRMIMARVRRTQERTVIPFRCDGPSVRRFMTLDISPCAADGVRFTGRTLREEQRDRVPLFDAAVSRTDEFVVVCSWCKRVDVAGGWLHVEDAVRRTGLFNNLRLPQITHGICLACREGLRQELDAEQVESS